VEDAVGRKPVLYSGFLIKQQLGSRIDGYLAAHRLWLAQYGPRPVTPLNWPSAWLWQFTGDGVGPEPHSVPGIVGSGIDINSYEGDAVKLTAEWSGPTTVEPPTA
jgi:GH25 family lysozyme M1 (1,4-beta-N-acetylmuramidase)